MYECESNYLYVVWWSLTGIKCITDHLILGRWEEARLPNKDELSATSVVQIEISEISGKVRTWPPSDKKSDYELDIWAGVLEYISGYEQIISNPLAKVAFNTPQSIKDKLAE